MKLDLKKIGTKKIVLGSVIVVVVALIALMSSSLFATNKAGYYQVKQAAITGKMSVRNSPGVYAQLFGDIFEYQISEMYYFSKHDEEGGSGLDSAPVKVRFNDGGTAEISGSIKFKLSRIEKDQIALHEDFKSFKAVQSDLVRQVVTEALMQTATLMKAEESYSTRRSEFTALAEAQIRDGIYETVSEERKKKDADNNEFIDKVVKVKIDSDNKPVVRKNSPFLRYKIEILQFVIKDIDFDNTIDILISKKKEAEQQKVVAKAKAEKAKQDAITALEQGKAEIAKAKAAEEVAKITAVTKAQKEFEVAKFNKLKADEDAQARLIKGRADAEANRLLVNAGLTPLERANIDKEIAIGVAAEMAKIKFPEMLIIGGNDSGDGALNPFNAVGLESFIKINRELSKTKK